MAGNDSWLPVLVLALSAVAFGLAPLVLARLWGIWRGTAKPGPTKNATYECGLESKGDAWMQFRSGYYVYAIVFLVFDVEAVFLVPFAVAFPGLSWGGFVAMLIFLLLLAEGLVWAWQKGVLNWGER